MRIALDPAMLNARPPQEAVRAAAAAGYGYLELGNRDDVIGAYRSVAADRERLASLVRTSADEGVEIVSVAVIQDWSDPDESVRRQAVAWWRDGIAAALALGARRFNTELSGDPRRPGECRDALFRSLDELRPIIEAEGLVVDVEPHPGDFIETTAGALQLIRATGLPWLRYLHCVPHTYYLGGSAREQIGRVGGMCDHVHVADTYRPGRTILNPPAPFERIHQHFDIGSGEVDWGEVTGALRAVGFDGIVTVQVFFWDERAEASFVANRAAAGRLFDSEMDAPTRS